MYISFAKIMYVFFLALFIFVFISDYKTWVPTFKQVNFIKKKEEEENNNF
jgi:hypothetical protein